MARYPLALLAGVLIAFSLPPWGWWPLAFLGLALLYRLLEGRSPRGRLLLGWLTGLGMFGIGIVWFGEFSMPGAVLAILAEALFIGVAGVLTPPTNGRLVAFPAALAVMEVARGAVPFGGIPLAGVSLGQVHGPLAPFARIAGGLGLLVLATVVGMALVGLTRRRVLPALVAVGVVAVAVVAGVLAPDGGPDGRPISIAIVQGGGRVGFRAVNTDPTDVENRAFAATEDVRGTPELLMWPEDVIDVDDPVERTVEGSKLADVAQRFGTTLVAGVVEGEGTDHFRNMSVAWGPDGQLLGRYEKVRRVPFGEYVPFRSFVKRIADLSAIPADAIAGTEAGLLRTPAGRLGILISYEVFFNDRGRHAVNAGGEVLLVPTNTASFSTSQVPTQELAAASLRALETGRWLAQAAPTGYSAIVRPSGRVVERSRLGARAVVTGTLHARHGRTLFVRFGDVPLMVLAALAVLAGLITQARAAAPREHLD
jgi:apolipoprotein N-acyltransferase